jgi:hypothetical protein
VNAIITTSIDREALKADAERLLHGSPLWAMIQGGLILNTGNPTSSGPSFGDLVQAVCASVEVVKANAVGMGSKDALDLALQLLDDAVRFGGPLGSVIELVDRPFLYWTIEIGMAVWRGKDWLVTAKTILGLVAAVA